LCLSEKGIMRRYTGPILVFGLALLTPSSGLGAPDGGTTVSDAMAHREASVQAIPVSDEAAMVMAGTALLGIAAAVRRAA
jgi:hypothetical protein